MANTEFAIKFKLDDSNFNAGLSRINKNMTLLKSEFKATSSNLNNFGSEADKLRNKQDFLNRTLQLQQQKVDSLKNAYAKSKDETGETSRATQNLAIKLNDAIANYNKFEGELKQTTTELQKQESVLQRMSLNMANGGNKMQGFGSQVSNFGSSLTRNVSVPLLGIGIASVRAGNNFEAQMSRVKAISGSTGEEFKSLNDLALQLGQDTSFSAREVATGMENLASAGFTTGEIMQSMGGLLDLASSSGEDLAVSSDIASSTLRGFGLEASQAGHVADVLAKASKDTNAKVLDIGYAMKYVAPVSKSFGLSLEEVTSSIGLMANAGIKGEQAGTTLRGALTKLVNPSDEASEVMANLGFSAFDNEGKMKSLSTIVQELGDSTKGLTQQQKEQAISEIFGTESLSGMLVLMDNGKPKIDEMTNALKNSDGTAKDMANTMKDNTSASIEQATGSMETAGIKIATVLAPSIKDVADTVGKLADKFSNLSPETQKAIVDFGLFAIAVGPTTKVIGSTVEGIGTITGLFSKLPTGLSSVGSGFSTLGGKIADTASKFGGFAKDVGLGALGKLKDFGGACRDVGSKALTLGSNIAKSALEFGKQGAKATLATGKLIAHKIATIASTIAQGALNLVMSLNPITLIVIAIGLLIGGLVLLYNKSDWFKEKWDAFTNFIKDKFQQFDDWLTNIFSTDWSEKFGMFGEILNGFSANVKNIWEGIKEIFSGIVDFVGGIFTGDWSRAWEGVKEIFGGIWDTFEGIAKTPLNAIISLVNMAIEGLNSINVSIPDWVPITGGLSFGFKIPKMNYLYEGGIIDRPTAIGNNTVVGDSYKGMGRQPEVVAPLEPLYRGIRNIVKQESNAQPINVYVEVSNNMDSKELSKVVANKVTKTITREQTNRNKGKGVW